jgi:hypothetical protein
MLRQIVLSMTLMKLQWIMNFLVLMKLEASRTTDISDISRMLGQASDLEFDQVRKTIPQSGRYANEMYDRNSMEDLESLIQLGKIEMS